MANILIQKLDTSKSPVITYTIDNIDICAVDYDMPASLLSMPQGDDTAAIAVKVTGNTSLVTISWILRDLTSTGTSCVSGSDPSIAGSTTVNKVLSIMQQLNFFDTHFQNTQITDIFRFKIDDSTTPYIKDGNLVRMRFSLTSAAPVTIQGDITIQTGSVIAAYNSDVPQPPTGLTATSSVAGQVVLSWTDSADHGSQPVTTHKIQYLTLGSQWTNAPNAASSPSTITGLVSGQGYVFRVATTSSKGDSDWSLASNWITVA